MKTLGRYEIIEQIGEGGMAVVFLANDPRFNRKVAIKVSPETGVRKELFRSRFEREAQTIASLEHHAIVPVYDFGEQEDQLFLVMRYMPGGSLSERLQQDTLSIQDISKIISRIASALDEAHAKGVIHRDLKPGNILFDHSNNAFLSDFGIVKVSNAATLTSDMIIGTPAYMSPEQAHGGAIDERSDIYSLGVVLFEMLSGELPFQADTPIGFAIKRITDPVPNILEFKSELSIQIRDLIQKAMAKRPEERFESAGSFARAFQTIISNKTFLRSVPESDNENNKSVVAFKKIKTSFLNNSSLRLFLSVVSVMILIGLIGFFCG